MVVYASFSRTAWGARVPYTMACVWRDAHSNSNSMQLGRIFSSPKDVYGSTDLNHRKLYMSNVSWTSTESVQRLVWKGL